MTFDTEGKHLYTAAYLGGEVGVYGRDPDTGLLSLIQVKEDNVDHNYFLDRVSFLVVDPNGRQVYASSGEIETLVTVFDRNVESGRLVFDRFVNRHVPPPPLIIPPSPPMTFDGLGRYFFSHEHLTIPHRL